MRTRTLTLILALTLTTLALSAQSEHLKFKGVPIDGTLKEFTSKLAAKGFTLLSQNNNTVIMMGKFAGHDDCTAYIFSNDNVDVVNGLVLYFQSLDSWRLLEGQYNSTKDLLTEKYGVPSECIEEFNSTIQPTTDRDKFRELRMERCTYKTTFSTLSGRIILSLVKLGYSECCVQLMYIDSINSDLARQSMLDDL